MSQNTRELMYTGTIISMGPIVDVSDSFRKQEFVLKDESAQYPDTVQFQCTQKRVDLLANYKVGSLVTVSFNLRGRQWTSPQNEVKTFNTLDVWRIAALSVDKGSQPVNEKPEDDLPF